jgi:hypothetical protein
MQNILKVSTQWKYVSLSKISLCQTLCLDLYTGIAHSEHESKYLIPRYTGFVKSDCEFLHENSWYSSMDGNIISVDFWDMNESKESILPHFNEENHI